MQQQNLNNNIILTKLQVKETENTKLFLSAISDNMQGIMVPFSSDGCRSKLLNNEEITLTFEESKIIMDSLIKKLQNPKEQFTCIFTRHASEMPSEEEAEMIQELEKNGFKVKEKIIGYKNQKNQGGSCSIQ